MTEKFRLPKVLVAAPTYDGKDYVLDKWVEAVKNLSYPNYDWCLVDNSDNTSYTKKLRMKGVKVLHVERGNNSRDAIANAQNHIRQIVLNGGYDYWLSLESDLIPPKDIIEKLMLQGKAIIGTIYMIGFENSRNEPQRPCLFVLDSKNGGVLGTRNLTPEEGFKMVGTGVQQVHGVGLGCTLIKRAVLERFSFWHDQRFNNKHSDVYFYMDLHNNGIPVYVDTNTVVQHYNKPWNLVKDM